MGLLITDIFETIIDTKYSSVNEQSVIKEAIAPLEFYKSKNYVICGISSHENIKAGFGTVRETINLMREVLKACSNLDRIYFASSDSECWIVTRNVPLFDNLPLWVKTFSRYQITEKEWNVGGFLKPNPGMVKIAIADFLVQSDLLSPANDIQKWISANHTQSFSELINQPILMTGDHMLDKETAKAANVEFISLENFYKKKLKQ